MLRLLFAPWWAFLLMVAVVGFVTEELVDLNQTRATERAAALAAPMPELVNLSDFNRSTDVGLMDETYVSGWIDTDHNTHLTKSKSGIQTGERYMFVMFGKDDDSLTKTARAALILTESEKARFIRDVDQYIVRDSANGPVLAFNGRASGWSDFARVADKAFSKQNLRKAPDFVFLEPYWEGREVVFAPKKDEVLETRLYGHGLAAVLFIVAVVKLLLSRAKGHAGRDQATGQDGFANGPLETGQGQPGHRPEMMGHATYQADTPIGRLHQTQEHNVNLIEPAPDTTIKSKRISKARKPLISRTTWLTGMAVLIVLTVIVSTGRISEAIPIATGMAALYYGYLAFSAVGRLASRASSGSMSARLRSNPFDRLQ